MQTPDRGLSWNPVASSVGESSNLYCLLQTRCAPDKCKSFTIRGSPRILIHISSSVIAGKEDTVVWRSMNHPTVALVRMVAPSPTVDEDKVSHGGERGNL